MSKFIHFIFINNILIVLIIAIVLIILGFIWVWLLRLQIKNKTESLSIKNLELQKSEEKFRIITENASDVIWHIDSNFIVTYISPADERIRGFKTEEAVGASLFSILKPEGIEIIKEANEKRMHELKNGIISAPVIYELEELCKDGSWIWIEATATAQYDKDGNISGYHGITRDIHKRKKAELLLKERESQLRELVSTKNKLFSIIAHDLRSPFTAILGFSELLIQNSNDSDANESRMYLEYINSSAQNTLVLLDNLLNWAQTQTGTINYDPEKINLASIVNETLLISRSTAKIKNIFLDYIQTDTIEVYADINMLKTILRNLISNAIKYTHTNGKITISAVQNQNNIEITVSDDGVGMSEETQNKLFKIDTTTSTIGTADERGSGLGLILCKEFVGKFGGKIWVKSELGKGSAFTFSLPVR
ncbi:MAG: PAS domain-containing sensor histidine kinase [Ginsengibacter sp.]|jgi:PAS domain S-box-containing protein